MFVYPYQFGHVAPETPLVATCPAPYVSAFNLHCVVAVRWSTSLSSRGCHK